MTIDRTLRINKKRKKTTRHIQPRHIGRNRHQHPDLTLPGPRRSPRCASEQGGERSKRRVTGIETDFGDGGATRQSAFGMLDAKTRTMLVRCLPKRRPIRPQKMKLRKSGGGGEIAQVQRLTIAFTKDLARR